MVFHRCGGVAGKGKFAAVNDKTWRPSATNGEGSGAFASPAVCRRFVPHTAAVTFPAGYCWFGGQRQIGAPRLKGRGFFLSGAFISPECRCGAALLPEACHEGV
jgi:hypothetical protein